MVFVRMLQGVAASDVVPRRGGVSPPTRARDEAELLEKRRARSKQGALDPSAVDQENQHLLGCVF